MPQPAGMLMFLDACHISYSEFWYAIGDFINSSEKIVGWLSQAMPSCS
jgi:hypothetical protein